MDDALVGRAREFAVLREAFANAAKGRMSVTFVVGEPGIGKTRLLDAIAAHAVGAGATVLRGGSFEAEGMPPYLPLLEALGGYIRSAPLDQLRAEIGPLAITLAAILPEVAARLGELPPGYSLPAEQSRLRLFEAVGSFLAAIAARTPLLLILDDLHWADGATLDLLCYIARQHPTARLAIIGAHRPGDTTRNPALERALAEMNRRRVLTPLPVHPLTAEETALLATRYLQGNIDDALGALLNIQSEGNPFFAEELLRGWLETGALAQPDTMWRLIAPPDETLPAGILAAIRQRTDRLPTDIRDLLRTAAIIGRAFDSALLAEVAGQEPEYVEERLQEALQTYLIRRIPPDGYTFNHDKVRECLYEEVTSVRRRRMHGFIGRALETRGTGDARALADLAFHFTRSGDRERGARYAEQAAQQAMERYAADEACTQYRMALTLVDPDDARRGSLLVGLGDAALLAGDTDEAVRAFTAGRAWFAAAEDIPAAARAAHRLGQAWWRQEALPQAHAAFEAAMTLLGDSTGRETIEVRVDLGSLLAMSLGQQTAGVRYGQQALTLARALGDPRLEASASRMVGNLLVRGNEIAAGVALLEQALTLATDADDSAEAAECCACLVMACHWQGDLRRSESAARQQIAFAQRSHDPHLMRHATIMLGARPAMQGDWAEAHRLLAQAYAIVEQQTSPEPLAFLMMINSLFLLWRGDLAEAEAMLADAIDRFRALGPGVLVWYLSPLGYIQLLRGKRQEALACMAEMEALLAAHETGIIQFAEAGIYLALMALHLEDHARCARYYETLLPFAHVHTDYPMDRILGKLAIALGDFPAAAQHLIDAERAAEREGERPELTRILVARAELALAQGGPDSALHARDLLGQARDLFAQLEMRWDLDDARDRLRTLPSQPGTQTRGALPAGLSMREATVLRLAAAGKSNREIAHDLALSEKTVANHLTSIFNKIGVDNRTAATAFAIRHDLA